MTAHQHGYSHDDQPPQPPASSFLDALMTWDGDIVELTFATGHVHAGIMQMSGDGQSVWMTGKWTRTPSVNNGWTLWAKTEETVYRVSHVVGIRHIRDQSKEL